MRELVRTVDEERNSGVRCNAIKAIGDLCALPAIITEVGQGRPELAALETAAKDADLDVRFDAATVLAQLGHVESAAPVFSEVLSRPEEHFEQTSVVLYWLAELGKKAEAFVPILEEYVCTLTNTASYAAGLTLIKIARHKAELLFMQLLDSSDLDKRWIGVGLLGALGVQGIDALPRLLNMLAYEPAAKVRAATARVLGEIGNGKREIIDALRLSLLDEDPAVRTSAAAALLTNCEADEQALGIIEHALKKEDKLLAMQALSDCSPIILVRFIPILCRIIRDSEKGRSIADKTPKIAAECLAKAGEPALKSLLAILNSTDLESHFWALFALQKMGAMAREAIPTILRIIDEAEVYEIAGNAGGRPKFGILAVNGAAPRALGHIVGPGDTVAIPYLVAELECDNEDIRSAAAKGLASIGYDKQR
jgi:HEAT repeat protein